MEQKDKKFSEWHGIERDKIDWNPNINKEKCIGCGLCVTSCGREVFDFDKEKNKSVVARPNNCMVGCTSCETWCIFNAINFPDKQYIKDLIKKKGLLKITKKELKEKMEANPCSCTG